MSRSCLLVVALLSGCANLSSINRTTDLPGGGKAIHLDATQRLVYSNIGGGICAEPTPDALQSYAAAMGASVGVNDKGSAALANAFSANSASVGLHTQSITLMRDTLYRICEYSHNQNSNPLDVVQLLQRSQDLTLGALAIEQLTGAVVARQAALGNGSNSTAGASINDTEAQLNAAQKNETNKKAELAAAHQAEIAQKDVTNAATAALAAEQAKPTPNADAVKNLTAALAVEQDKLDTLTAATADATAAVVRARTAAAAIESMFNTAMASNAASTSGTVQLVGGGTSQNVNTATAQALANATLQIVNMVINKGHLTDTCMNFLTRARPVDMESATYANLAEQCAGVIKTDVTVYADLVKAWSFAGPAASAATVVPASAPVPFVPQITLSAPITLDPATLKKFKDAIMDTPKSDIKRPEKKK